MHLVGTSTRDTVPKVQLANLHMWAQERAEDTEASPGDLPSRDRDGKTRAGLARGNHIMTQGRVVQTGRKVARARVTKAKVKAVQVKGNKRKYRKRSVLQMTYSKTGTSVQLRK